MVEAGKLTGERGLPTVNRRSYALYGADSRGKSYLMLRIANRESDIAGDVP
jgi:GTPase SAR1 family protein